MNARAPNQPMSSTALICSFVSGGRAQASVEPCRLKRQQVLHEEHGRRITWEGKRDRARSLDAPFVVEVRDARLLVRRSYRSVDILFDPGCAPECCQALALRLFPLDCRFTCVLHGEDAPRAGQRIPQRRLVIEIALDDVDALAGYATARSLPLARQAAQWSPAPCSPGQPLRLVRLSLR